MSDQPQDPGQPVEHPEAVATVEHGGGGAHETPTALGFITAPVAISLAMILVFAILVWKKVPGAIGKALDAKIALIREQLEEARQLRAEAEALKAEYEAKAAAADAERETMLDRARQEAAGIVEQAKADSAALVERRGRMAEDKIAAAERTALAQVRARAADAATAAAARLIAEQHDAEADKAMIDKTIAALGRTH